MELKLALEIKTRNGVGIDDGNQIQQFSERIIVTEIGNNKKRPKLETVKRNDV